MLSRGRESCSPLPCRDKEEGRKVQLTVPHLIPEENKDTIPQITCLDTHSFKSEHVFRGLCFLQPAEPSFQEISCLSWWPGRFSCAGLDSCFPMAIKEILSQNCYIPKVLRSFILFCCQRKSLAVFTSLHEGAGEANSFGSNGCLTQEKQLTEVTSAPLDPLVLYPSPLPEEAFLQGYFVIETGK